MHKRYLIINKKEGSFYSDHWDYENLHIKGSIVVDLYKHKITFNGMDWFEVEDNHL